MPVVSRCFQVEAEPQQVLDYLKDFSNATEWDPGTQSCTQEGSGPVEVGTTWHNVSKIAGFTTELTYELVEVAPDRVVLVGRNKGATSTDTITVQPSGTGSEVTYHADLEMHGVSKLASPAMKVIFEKLGDEVQENLTRVLARR